MLSESLQREDECFYFASRATYGRFDGCFVLEEEIFWIRVPIELWEDGWVETWRPRDLFEFYGEGGGGVLLWVMLLWAKLVWYLVLVFLFVRVLVFGEGGCLRSP